MKPWPKESIMKNMSPPTVIAAAILLGISLAGPTSARAAAPQHHDQVPGFQRLAVGDLEVTSLYDGGGQFEPRWLNGRKKVMTAVASTVQKEPHFLDGAESGFLVNTGKQVILVDSGAGQWWGGGALGRLETSLRSAGYTPEQVDLDDRQRTANLNDDARHIVRRKRRQSWASTRARSRS